MKRKNKGFTLIELLAVIVILGLLMAIAIPSVTKYITESRKKTLATTLGNYIGALVNDVNDLEYTFTGTNTIYAVPIECISLERGGTDPFGHWYQANDAYFAYVLIQYDDSVSKYIYGFTFKDSAGYGLYPTIQANIDEKGSQVKTGYTINKPKTGELTSLVTLAKWQESGFKIDSNTHLQVLEATSENETGDGTSTCTLQQKGDNYAQVEDEKVSNKEDNDNDDIIQVEKIDLSGTAYAIYSADDQSLTFVRSQTPISAGSTYNEKKVTKVYTGFEQNTYTSANKVPWYSYRDSILLVETINYIQPVSTSYWFYQFQNCKVLNLDKVETSKLTNMSYTFYYAGRLANSFSITGLDKWDTSNVTNMSYLFEFAGVYDWNIGDISKWDTSNVENMENMFRYAGYRSDNFILNLSDWNVSNVKTFSSFLANSGYNSSKWVVGNLSNWNVSNTNDINHMFSEAGFYMSNNFNIGDISNWNTSNIVKMNGLFYGAGYSSSVFYVGDLSKWDTSNVTNMTGMFYVAGYKAYWELDLRSWNVDKVTSHANFDYGSGGKVDEPYWKN